MKTFIKSILPKPVLSMKRWCSGKCRQFTHSFRTSMSQVGQDIWVYGEVYNRSRGKYFVDLGAHDGVFLSNTFVLERKYGWKGLCIEANPITFKSLESNRTCHCVNKCVTEKPGIERSALQGVAGHLLSVPDEVSDACVCEIESDSLERILVSAGAPAVVDYLSVDIEGAEDRALLNLALPRI